MVESHSKPSRIEELKGVLKEYPWDFMTFIFLSMLIPRIYSMTNTFWVGHID